MGSDEILATARSVLNEGSRALACVAEQSLCEEFVEVVRTIASSSGRLVATGMGKAGFIAQKVSATFASTGTPSLFLHPADALHGDLGRITASDVVLAFSSSGETEEILRLIGPLERVGSTLVGVTSTRDSTLGRKADRVLATGRFDEAGHGLAPTTSTTAMLGLGDALAMSVVHVRGFTEDQFYFFHPGGALGRQRMQVAEVMRKGREVPKVGVEDSLASALAVMTKTPGRPGAALVVDPSGRLLGMFTDGDLRRLLEGGDLRLERKISEVMSTSPKTVRPDQLAVEAARMLREYRVDQVPVVDPETLAPVGLLDVQDLLALRFL